MATTLRMQRHGNSHRPFYHIVAANSRASATKKFLEKLGYYDPNQEPSTFSINEERVRYWYGTGATVSNTLEVLLKKKGVKLERVKGVSTAAATKPKKAVAAKKPASPAKKTK